MVLVRFLRFVLKAAVLGLFVAAMLNPSIEVGTARRCRVYLVDRSDSVKIQHAAPGALRVAEVVQTINYDMSRLDPSDHVALALFGRTFAFQMMPRPRGEQVPVIADLTAEVDSGGSDVVQALRAVKLQMPPDVVGEVVLFSDGNFVEPAETIGAAARALGLNLYGVGVGDPQPKDVKILRVDPPRLLRDGELYAVDVEVESTVSGPVTLTCADQSKQLPLVAHRRAILRFDGLKADAAQKAIHIKAVASGFDDLCPENNQVQVDLLFEQRKPKLLILTSEENPPLARAMAHDYDVKVSKNFEHPMEYHAVVLDNFAAPPESAMNQIYQYVTSLGGGLVVIGGPRAFGSSYAGTPLEKVSPFWSFPDDRAGIVFVLDASGSMDQEFQGKRKIRWLTEAVMAATQRISDKDEAAVVTFTDRATVHQGLTPLADRPALAKKLSEIRVGGPTHIVSGLAEALALFKEQERGIRHVVLITDGDIPDDPGGEQSIERFRKLGEEFASKNIGVSIFVTGEPKELRRLGELRGEIYRSDFAQLAERLAEKTAADRGVFAERVPVQILPHELTEGLRPFTAPWINRLSKKDEATLLANSERGPIAAVWKRGTGQCAALACAEDRLVPRAIRYVTSKRDQARFTSIPDRDRLRIRLSLTGVVPAQEVGAVTGTYQHPRTGTSDVLRFVRTGERDFEAELVRPLSGSYHIDVPDLQSRGSVEVMCHPELMNLGIHVAALSSAGTLVGDVAQIRSNRVAVEEGLRPWLAAAALALLLVELLLGAFWK